jgi:tetratricopeptide (TPR) repeat protein
MKKLFFLLAILLLNYYCSAQLTKNGVAIESRFCIYMEPLQFKESCLGDGADKGMLAAITYITNQCEQAIDVSYKFSGKIHEKYASDRDFGTGKIRTAYNIKPGQRIRIEICHTVPYSGDIVITSVVSKNQSNNTSTYQSSSNTTTYQNNNSNLQQLERERAQQIQREQETQRQAAIRRQQQEDLQRQQRYQQEQRAAEDKQREQAEKQRQEYQRQQQLKYEQEQEYRRQQQINNQKLERQTQELVNTTVQVAEYYRAQREYNEQQKRLYEQQKAEEQKKRDAYDACEKSIDSYLSLGNTYWEKEDYQKAKNCYTLASEINIYDYAIGGLNTQALQDKIKNAHLKIYECEREILRVKREESFFDFIENTNSFQAPKPIIGEENILYYYFFSLTEGIYYGEKRIVFIYSGPLEIKLYSDGSSTNLFALKARYLKYSGTSDCEIVGPFSSVEEVEYTISSILKHINRPNYFLPQNKQFVQTQLEGINQNETESTNDLWND